MSSEVKEELPEFKEVEAKPAEILMQIKRIPKIFMVKTDRTILKVSYIDEYTKYNPPILGYLNASFYISRTGLTWAGVAKYNKDDDKINIIRGIYYFQTKEYYVRKSVRKIERNIENMLDSIKNECKQLNIHNAVVEFNNYMYKIHINYKIRKSPLLQFNNTLRQGNLYISLFKYPIYNDVIIEPKLMQEIQIYNHVITCNKPFYVLKPTFVSAGQFYMLYFDKQETDTVQFKITSQDHSPVIVNIRPNQESLIVYHPVPVKRFD
jgi:hypothetical protein